MRPNWDEYFLGMCFEVAKRSNDKFVKLGAIITTNNHIIGTGYNDVPARINEAHLDLYDRDARREHTIHAEINAILNCYRLDSYKTLYVNGIPCIPCMDHMTNFGIKRIVYLDKLVSNNYILSPEQKQYLSDLVHLNQIEMVPISTSNKWINNYIQG